jgi:hypothetical protein
MIAVNILNVEKQAAEKEWSSIVSFRRELKTANHKNISVLQNVTQDLEFLWILLNDQINGE